MASTITALGTPLKITLGNQPLATKVILGGSALGLGKRVTLYFETNAGRYSNAGTDGVDIGDHYEHVPEDTPYDVFISTAEHGAVPAFYLAADTNATVVRVTVKAA